MNLETPQRLDALAATYVLGTLRGPARVRFEHEFARSAVIREAVDAWRERLLPLSAGLPPVMPPAEVKRALDARLFQAEPLASAAAPLAAPAVAPAPVARPAPASVSTPVARPAPAPAPRTPWWQQLFPWQLAAGFATAAALVLALRIGVEPPAAVPQPGWVAVMQDEAGRATAALQLQAAPEGGGRIAVKVLQAPDLPADRALELWSIPPGGTPRSLGLLPAGGATLPAERLARLEGATALAVSVEPTGGSPTGSPTGPVIWQGALHRL